ncbi:MAG: UDP-N-acetylglucosamine--N-acetylmuramyl-(pentapeptide) pyrophosphoryl-undecaprenol N-acetylglucosamine transferase [Planctomycetes bacterium]|nr:UDP-N-acetylglucosamine--N-acetylmuramyl-(pentapeptide) pyrophosphoryl-undecaprenol N-acetylglucosamine transferase [Planctomycetota bacterium]
MPNGSTILLAGGGTGGHIFPNLAIAERLAEGNSKHGVHYIVSLRPIDASILAKQQARFTAIPAKAWSSRPWHWPEFYKSWRSSIETMLAAIREHGAVALVATGGFVSAPAVIAAKKAGIPAVMVNLDAVPGRANQFIAGRADQVFSVYPSSKLVGAQIVGLPLRHSAVGPRDKGAARQALGLDPDKETLFVTGASQGAQSINKMMIELVTHSQSKRGLASWQVLHLTGGTEEDAAQVRAAYDKAGIPGRTETFCNAMGMAWSAASIAISRSGAGSVGEAWANATPSIFLPYPYHKDQHQKLNAEPLVQIGSALLQTDEIDPMLNARRITGPLLALMSNAQRRIHMAEKMREKCPPDGAKAVAQWLLHAVG